MAKKMTWRDKLQHSKDLPKIVTLNEKGRIHWHAETMVVPAPLEVDARMAQVPRGQVITTDLIRQDIARVHGADIGCPLTTGIFAWIAANAAAEDLAEGRADATPYWRTLKAGGELNPKYPGGVEAQRAHLEAEGLQIRQRGKRFFVVDFADHLAALAPATS